MAQEPQLPAHPGEPPDAPRGFTLTPRAIGAVVLLALLVVFIVENSTSTKIRFIVPTVHAPLSLALLAGVAVGILAGYLLGRSARRGRGDKH